MGGSTKNKSVDLIKKDKVKDRVEITYNCKQKDCGAIFYQADDFLRQRMQDRVETAVERKDKRFMKDIRNFTRRCK